MPRTSETPIEAVAVLAERTDDGAVLFIRRAKEPFKGLWGLPGGRIRTGESPAAAAHREFTEETGFDAGTVSMRAVIRETFLDSDAPVRQVVLHLARARPGGRTAGAGELKTEWFSDEEIEARRAEIIPTDYLFIREIHRKDETGAFTVEITDTLPPRINLFEKRV